MLFLIIRDIFNFTTVLFTSASAMSVWYVKLTVFSFGRCIPLYSTVVVNTILM